MRWQLIASVSVLVTALFDKNDPWPPDLSLDRKNRKEPRKKTKHTTSPLKWGTVSTEAICGFRQDVDYFNFLYSVVCGNQTWNWGNLPVFDGNDIKHFENNFSVTYILHAPAFLNTGIDMLDSLKIDPQRWFVSYILWMHIHCGICTKTYVDITNICCSSVSYSGETKLDWCWGRGEDQGGVAVPGEPELGQRESCVDMQFSSQLSAH